MTNIAYSLRIRLCLQVNTYLAEDIKIESVIFTAARIQSQTQIELLQIY